MGGGWSQRSIITLPFISLCEPEANLFLHGDEGLRQQHSCLSFTEAGEGDPSLGGMFLFPYQTTATLLPLSIHTDGKIGQPIVKMPDTSFGAEPAWKVRKREAKSRSVTG